MFGFCAEFAAWKLRFDLDFQILPHFVGESAEFKLNLTNLASYNFTCKFDLETAKRLLFRGFQHQICARPVTAKSTITKIRIAGQVQICAKSKF